MAERKFGFDYTDGSAATVGAASGTNLGGTGSSQQANGSWTYNASLAKLEGTTGLRAVVTTVTTTISRFTPSTTTNTLMSIGFAVRIDQIPTRTFHAFASIRNSGGPSCRVFVNTSGVFGLRGSGTSAPEVLASNPLSIGKMYWVVMLANATANTVTVEFYDTDTRQLVSSIVDNNVLTKGTTAFTAFDLGWINSDPTAGHTVNFDSLVIDDGSTTRKFPASWATPASLAGSLWTGTSLVSGRYQVWNGTALQELKSVIIN